MGSILLLLLDVTGREDDGFWQSMILFRQWECGTTGVKGKGAHHLPSRAIRTAQVNAKVKRTEKVNLMPQHPFDPQTDSFAFPNYWTLDTATTGEIRSRLHAAVEDTFTFLAPVPAIAPLRDSVTRIVENWVNAASIHAYGLCGGMAFAALDYYIADHNIPAESSPTDQLPPWLRAYILKRMINSLACNNLARVLAWMVVEHHAPFASGKRLLLRWTLAECAKLRDLIAQFGAWPIALIGEAKDPCQNHQVLAYRCELEQGRCTIQVYDVNYPCAGRELSVDLHGPYVELASDGRNDSWQPLRGLFCEEYSPVAPPQIAEISPPNG